MQISILGPGAVGTLIGGLLRLKGHEVFLIGKKQPAKGHARQEVRIVLPDRWLTAEGLRYCSPAEAPAKADAFIVALGRQHVHVMRRPDLARLTPSGSPVVFLNADPPEIDRLVVPRERGALCCTLMSAVKLQECDVELCTPRPVIVAEKESGLVDLFSELSVFGFQILAVDDPDPFANSLLVWQSLFLPVAMCNTTLADFLSHSEGRQIARAVLEEGIAAMGRAGQPLARLPLFDPQELALRLKRKPGSFDAERTAPGHEYNSVLQSYLTRRPTEVGSLNKRLVDIASSAGMHIDWNWKMLQKTSRVTSLGFYRDPAELLGALA